MRAPLAGVLVAAALCVVVSPVEAQFVTLGEKVPETSGCYKPSTYNNGVNLDIKVWSNTLAASDLRSLGIQPSEIRFETDAKGRRPTMARLTLARKIAAITLIVWKKGASFDAKHLKQAA